MTRNTKGAPVVDIPKRRASQSLTERRHRKPMNQFCKGNNVVCVENYTIPGSPSASAYHTNMMISREHAPAPDAVRAGCPDGQDKRRFPSSPTRISLPAKARFRLVVSERPPLAGGQGIIAQTLRLLLTLASCPTLIVPSVVPSPWCLGTNEDVAHQPVTDPEVFSRLCKRRSRKIEGDYRIVISLPSIPTRPVLERPHVSIVPHQETQSNRTRFTPMPEGRGTRAVAW